MCRDNASISAIACSAADMLFPSGALTTMIPRCVAASMSMLSTPAPARPITSSFFAASMMDAVTFVSLRTTRASYSPMMLFSSSGEMPSRTSTSACAASALIPSCAMGSVTRTLRTTLSSTVSGLAGGREPPPRQGLSERVHAALNVRLRHQSPVPHAEYLPSQSGLAARQDRIILLAHHLVQRLAVDALRPLYRRPGVRSGAHIG